MARDEQGWAAAVRELDPGSKEEGQGVWADEYYPEVCGRELDVMAEVFVPTWPELGSAVKVKTEPKFGLRRSKRGGERGKIK